MSGLHTPGPWAVNPFVAQVDSSELDGDGNLIPVCKMLWPTRLRSEEATDANANLIAAAPDLLAVLEGLTERLVKGDSIGFARIEAAVAAIAKARGEA